MTSLRDCHWAVSHNQYQMKRGLLGNIFPIIRHYQHYHIFTTFPGPMSSRMEEKPQARGHFYDRVNLSNLLAAV